MVSGKRRGLEKLAICWFPAFEIGVNQTFKLKQFFSNELKKMRSKREAILLTVRICEIQITLSALTLSFHSCHQIGLPVRSMRAAHVSNFLLLKSLNGSTHLKGKEN